MKKMLICNHKMFLTGDEASNLSNLYDEIDFSTLDLVVCPGYMNFCYFDNYILGAQNCSYEDKGAYTGEVSPYDLSIRKVKYVILGHSERRQFESDDMINQKVKACIRNALTPIICIGETRLEKEMMKTSMVLKRQITKVLKDINLSEEDNILIAYEPIYKIGSKTTLPKKEIEDVILYIKKVLEELNIQNYKILYGGSVNGSNISGIKSNLIDGYLIGKSSVEINDLKSIVNNIK